MRRFLEAVAETGVVEVPERAELAARERVPHDDLLVAADAAARLEAPGDAPALDLDAARWSARTLLRACCSLADRTVGEAEVRDLLREGAPGGSGASVQWSVDLFLRHLPELRALAHGLAPADPLVREIEALGAAWPLSSVGMPPGGGRPAPTRELLEHPCLLALYADRVLARGDTSRLGVPAVDERVRAALGGHPELAPAAALVLGLGGAAARSA